MYLPWYWKLNMVLCMIAAWLLRLFLKFQVIRGMHDHEGKRSFLLGAGKFVQIRVHEIPRFEQYLTHVETM